MAYYGVQEPDNIRAQIRSTRGETIDLSVPIDCTLSDLRNFLIEQYDYSPDTRLVYNNRPAPDSSFVNDYPYGSLLITSGPPPQPALPPRQAVQQPAPSRTVGGGMPSPSYAQQQQQQQQPPPHFQQRPTYPASHQTPPATSSQAPARKPVTSPSAASTQAPSVRTPRADAKSPDSSRKAAGTTATAPVQSAPMPSPPPPSVPQPPQRPPSRNGGGGGGSARSRPADVPAPAPQPPSARGGRRSTEGSVDGGSGNRQANASRPPNSKGEAHNGSGPSAPPPSSAAKGDAAPHSTRQADENGEEKAPWQLATFTVDCIIPDLDKTVSLQVNGDASVADLILAVVAALPEVAGGAKVVYHGKVLPQTPQSKLFNFGIRTDARVYIASGKYASADTITLLEIENDVDEIAQVVEKESLTDLQRKGYYESLMRILFRTDGLMELEGEWRQRRKDTVAHIKRLQDILHPEDKG